MSENEANIRICVGGWMGTRNAVFLHSIFISSLSEPFPGCKDGSYIQLLHDPCVFPATTAFL